MSNLYFANQIFFGKFEFLFHEDSKYTVYGNIAVYIKYSAVCLKIDYTLRCLEYICSEISPLRRHVALAPLGLLIVKILTTVLYLLQHNHQTYTTGQTKTMHTKTPACVQCCCCWWIRKQDTQVER